MAQGEASLAPWEPQPYTLITKLPAPELRRGEAPHLQRACGAGARQGVPRQAERAGRGEAAPRGGPSSAKGLRGWGAARSAPAGRTGGPAAAAPAPTAHPDTAAAGVRPPACRRPARPESRPLLGERSRPPRVGAEQPTQGFVQWAARVRPELTASQLTFLDSTLRACSLRMGVSSSSDPITTPRHLTPPV